MQWNSVLFSSQRFVFLRETVFSRKAFAFPEKCIHEKQHRVIFCNDRKIWVLFFFHSLAKKCISFEKLCIRSLNLCVPQESLHSLKKNSKDLLANASWGKNLWEKISWRMKKKHCKVIKHWIIFYFAFSKKCCMCAQKPQRNLRENVSWMTSKYLRENKKST